MNEEPTMLQIALALRDALASVIGWAAHGAHECGSAEDDELVEAAQAILTQANLSLFFSAKGSGSPDFSNSPNAE